MLIHRNISITCWQLTEVMSNGHLAHPLNREVGESNGYP